MARVVRFHQFGTAEVLKLEDVPDRSLQAEEVRIRVKAIGLNRAEVAFREGRYLERPANLPSGLGYEASGIVEAVGAAVTEFVVGDRVSTIPAFSMSKYGVYGEIAIAPVHAVAKFPEHLSFEQAASIWMQYMTAFGALVEYARIGPGDFVVITAASSSVGLAAIQIVNAAGGVPIATTRGASKKQRLLDDGAKHVIVTDEEKLPARVLEITSGVGARVIFDPIAGPFVKTLAEAAAMGGTIYEYGALSGADTPFPLFRALQKGLSVRGYTMFEVTNNPAMYERAKTYVYSGLQSKKFEPVIDRVFKLEEIVEAHKHMESNLQYGKIVVSVD